MANALFARNAKTFVKFINFLRRSTHRMASDKTGACGGHAHYEQYWTCLNDNIKSLREGNFSNVYYQLDEVLTRLQGLPPSNEGLPLEMASVYTKLSTKIYMKDFNCPVKDINTCLERVYESCLQRVDFLEKDDNVQCLRLIDRLVGNDKFLRHIQDICRLVLVQAIHWLVTGHMIYVIRAVTRLLPQLQKVNEKPNHLPLAGMNSSVKKEEDWLEDSLQVILAFAYYSTGSLRECLTHTKDNKKGYSLTPYKIYLQASVHYKQGEYSNVLHTLMPLSQDNTISNTLSAKVLTLIGVSLAKQNKPHTAIQTLHRAIKADMTHVSALYNVALQYGRLQSPQAQLDALNLCVQCLKTSEKPSRCSILLQLIHNKNGADFSSTNSQQMDLLSLLQLLGNRYLQLNKFDKSSDIFSDILYHVMDGGSNTQCDIFSVSLPDVFHRLTYALLQCGHYADAQTVCDQAVYCSKLTSKQSYPHNQNSQEDELTIHYDVKSNDTQAKTEAQIFLHMTDKRQSKKRARSLNVSQSQEEDGDTVTDADARSLSSWADGVAALLYQADALAHQNRLTEAVESLDSVIKFLNSKQVDVYLNEQTPRQPSKRRRVSPETGVDLDEADSIVSMSGLLSIAYCNKAVILLARDQIQPAMHCLRLSLQNNSENMEALYNQCLLLFKCGKIQDAIKVWFTRRDIDYHGDSLYLSKQLKDRQSKQRLLDHSTCASEINSSEDSFLKFDIVCIKRWTTLKSNFIY